MPMTSACTIRPAEQADLEQILALLRASALPTEGVTDSMNTFVVAERAGALTGVAGLELLGEFALLRSVVVSQECRGTGVGASLVSRVLEDAERRGIREVYLLTTTAERWFPAFGFSVVSRHELPGEVLASAEVSRICPGSAVVMRRGKGTRSAR